jgi:hypothetical protein
MRKRLAKLTSHIVNPFMVSLAVMVLLSFRSSATAAIALKWALLSVALSVLPVFAVMLYLVRRRKLSGIFENPRRQRYSIYLLSSSLALVDCIILYLLGAPVLLLAAFVAGLAAMIVFMAINMFWKISLHTGFIAASVAIMITVYGGMGALTVVLLLPVAWARVELGQHSLAQVTAGALIVAAIVVAVFGGFGLIGAA